MTPVLTSDRQCDFRRCKLCGMPTSALYHLGEGQVVYACSTCDFHFLNALDGSEPPGKDSGLDENSKSYIEERIQSFDPLPALRIDLMKRHCVLHDATCLDIGAGVGQFMMRLSEEGAKTFGLEPSRIRRQFAREKFGLELIPQKIENFRPREEYLGRFDAVTMWDVIEHVNSPVATMAAAFDVLKPGGLLFLDTPSRESASYRLSAWACRLSSGRFPLYLANFFYSSAPYGHKQIFRPGQLAGLAEKTGFEVVELTNGYVPLPRFTSIFTPRNRLVLTCRRA